MRNQWNKIQFSPSVALIRTALTFSIKMEVEEKYEKVFSRQWERISWSRLSIPAICESLRLQVELVMCQVV